MQLVCILLWLCIPADEAALPGRKGRVAALVDMGKVGKYWVTRLGRGEADGWARRGRLGGFRRRFESGEGAYGADGPRRPRAGQPECREPVCVSRVQARRGEGSRGGAFEGGINGAPYMYSARVGEGEADEGDAGHDDAGDDGGGGGGGGGEDDWVGTAVSPRPPASVWAPSTARATWPAGAEQPCLARLDKTTQHHFFYTTPAAAANNQTTSPPTPTIIPAPARPCRVPLAAIAASHRTTSPPRRMRWSWTGRPSSSRGKRDPLRRRRLLRLRLLYTANRPNSGLVLASAYLSTATPLDYSFALDKPLHTLALVLLLTGLALVAAEAWSSRRRPHHHTHYPPQQPATYIALALSNVQTRHPGEEIWSEAGLHGRPRAWSVRAVGALLALLLFAICGRIAIFYRVISHVECSGPSAWVRRPAPCLFAATY